MPAYFRTGLLAAAVALGHSAPLSADVFILGDYEALAPSGADSFLLRYDDSVNGSIGNVIGIGSFSYDGPYTVGSYALSSLTGLSYTATFTTGAETIGFTQADLISDPDTTGISVFERSTGVLGLVFTGISSDVFGGDFDLVGRGYGLSHEPTFAIDERVGCCGGDGTINEYFITTVPEPGPLALLGAGLLGLAWLRHAERARHAPAARRASHGGD